MSHNAYNVRNKNTTPQSAPIPGKEEVMVKNNAGGFVFQLDEFKQLERFLILGTSGGTYYVSERNITKENAAIVDKCLAKDWKRTIDLIVEISDAGRAIKNDPALFALAIAASNSNSECRVYALDKLGMVARTGTHLFHFVQYLDGMRSWGRAVRNGIGKWYNRNTKALALQLAKYQQRDGWSHRDILRLAHPKPASGEQADLFAWAVGKPYKKLHGLVEGLEKMKTAKSESEVVALIKEYSAPMEIVPTEYKKSVKVWEAMLPTLGLTAIIRNLGNMSTYGVLAEGKWANIEFVVNKLKDAEELRKARVHPIQLVLAYLTYRSGQGVRGDNSWKVIPQIVDALNAAVYLSFGSVQSTNKSYYLGIDVSGSMGSSLSGIEQMSCAQGAAVMAMTIARTEPKYIIKGFSSVPGGRYSWSSRDNTIMKDLGITAQTPLSEAFDKVHDSNFGATDCALPVIEALNNNIFVDVFVTITDNETWVGSKHPSIALKEYRSKINKNAALVVIGMTSSGFTIADPSDALSLDVVGFDTNTPNAIAEFVRSIQ